MSSELSRPKTSFAGEAFGMLVCSGFEIAGLRPLTTRRSPPQLARMVEIERAPRESSATRAYTERTFSLRGVNDRVIFTIDHDPVFGYRVWIADLGWCELTNDGRHIVCSPAPGEQLRWRLLQAQGLPIAAALQGLEVLHASAVVLQDEGMAITGPSGAGKTSTALNLVRLGAQFVSDDVVAIEDDGNDLILHPGINVAHVSAAEHELLTSLGYDIKARSGPGEKTDIEMPDVDGPVRLAHLYFLSRSPHISRTEITRLFDPDPRRLLGSTFVAHVPTRARAVTQLDICSRIARSVAVHNVVAPARGGADEVASAIAAHHAMSDRA